MLKTPKLPEKEELEYKEQQFLLTLFEQYQESSKIWFVILLGLLILAVPLKILLQETLLRSFLAGYQPPPVNQTPYTPMDLRLIKTQTISVASKRYQALAQIVNPNLEISARDFWYVFIFQDADGKELKRLSGQNYVLAGESKYIIIPDIELAGPPTTTNFLFQQAEWTRRIPPYEVKLEVVQQGFGTTAEGRFFVEGLVKNLQDWQIKKVEVKALVWDRSLANIIAVNGTVLNDLKTYESRYFRLLWPKNFSNVGRVQVIPSVNLFDPGLILSDPKKIPLR